MLLRNICNYLIFLPGWIVCIYYHNLYAALVGLALYLVNLAITKKFKKYLLLTVVIAVFGYLNEVLILFGNAYKMTGSSADNLWLIVIWLLFASIIPFSINFFSRLNLFLQFVIAGTIGNWTYFFALRYGAIELAIPEYKALVVFFVNFGLLAPMLFRVSNILSEIIDTEDYHPPSDDNSTPQAE